LRYEEVSPDQIQKFSHPSRYSEMKIIRGKMFKEAYQELRIQHLQKP
jgi:hypothetical protein